MKEDKRPHTCNRDVSSMAVNVRDESHTIMNFKPKVRIIHIFAPEIIKTDAANFRELVQRLTGKPEGRKGGRRVSKKALSGANDKMSQRKKESSMSFPGCQDSGFSDRIKGEEEMWRGENSSSFFSGLGDLDGFMQELGDFPLVPLNSSRLEAFGESRDASFLV